MNPREIDVLNILWATTEPMMGADIVRAKNGLTQSTVTAVLRKLLSEGLVEAVGVMHSGKVLSRIYRPTESSKECVLDCFAALYGSCKNILTAEQVMGRLKIEDGKREDLGTI